MENKTYKWLSFDEKTLFGQSWIPNTKPKAVINFVHGIGEHTDRYSNWMPFFVEAGYAVFAIEYRGHGRSFGKQGYIKNYNDLLNDIDTLLKQSYNSFPNLPHFLYGHSLGGGMVIHHALTRKSNIKALIASSPWLLLTQEPPKWQIIAVEFLRKIIPGLVLKSTIKSDDITQNKNVIKAYKEDKMIHNKISIELFLSAYDNGKWNIKNAHKMPVPFLLTHGSNDNITNIEGSKSFYNNNPEKTNLKIWEGMFHELHNEPIREEYAQFIIEWLNTNLKGNV